MEKIIDISFWVVSISFILSFIGFIVEFFGIFKNFLIYLILTYFSGLLLYIGFFIGFKTIGEILENKLLFYSSFAFVFLAITHTFFLLSIYFGWARKIFSIIYPWIDIFEYLALIIFSLGLFSLKHKFGIFASLSALFLALNCVINLFVSILSLPLPSTFFLFTRFLAYIFALIILFKAKNLKWENERAQRV